MFGVGLVEKIIDGLGGDSGFVVELGLGIGVFMEKLLFCGVLGVYFVVVEVSYVFVRLFVDWYLDFIICYGNVVSVCVFVLFEIGMVKIVICGLFLLFMLFF